MLVPIKKQTYKGDKSQHIGYGRRLLKTAELIAYKSGYHKVAVISGVGVRNYYRKFGYVLDNTYMVKTFNNRTKLIYTSLLLVNHHHFRKFFVMLLCLCIFILIIMN